MDGIVQGVGFRPFVFRLAGECGLAGFVNNGSDGVTIEVEGAPARVEAFRDRLSSECPPLARVVEMCHQEIQPVGDLKFSIKLSDPAAEATTLISPDVTVCDDCLREMLDPADRRFRYPFINCTNCGPRYTIVEGIPYDRPLTSMKVFPMCQPCAEEYHDPADRRFHAQPNACPACGPSLSLRDKNGNLHESDDPLSEAVNLLRHGYILALRGVGGFHLAVEAGNDAAVRELRRRKGRAEKPFALMVRDVASAEKLCHIDESEKTALLSRQRPIVLLRARKPRLLPESIAPGNRFLGVMLPYTPLHHLLLQSEFDALVMTSGNFSEEPIAFGNDEALQRLAPLADFFLLHDREILQRCDDSIVRVAIGEPRVIRRSRGYVPEPVFLLQGVTQPILACGGELKNTIALARGRAVFLSQHIGNLDNPSALAFFEHSISHLQEILRIQPELLAHDMHPEYLSTKWAVQQRLPKIAVQHHHAHLAAVMAENGVTEPTIGLILDGTGYGTDGTIWGGEVLVGDAAGFERFAWLEPVPLPGGAAAIKQPWRMALSCLEHAYGKACESLDLPFLRNRGSEETAVVLQMIRKRLNAPLTSSCGRIFDAIAALIDLRGEVTFEAQAAIELEMCVDPSEDTIYARAISAANERDAISVAELVRSVVSDLRVGLSQSRISARFHRSLVEMFVQAAIASRQQTGINRVGLSGGVYQNSFFFDLMQRRLCESGFEVLTHRQVPTNDGGLALGQVAIAAASSGSPRS